MTNLTDDEFDRRFTIILNQIEKGCGNPYCDIIHCKSNIERLEIDDNDKDEYLVTTTTENFSECQRYIHPKDVMTMNYKTLKLELYLTNVSILYSFIDFEKNHQGKENDVYDITKEKRDFESMFEFFKRVSDNSRLMATITHALERFSGDILQRKSQMIFLTIPYKESLFTFFGKFYEKLMKTSKVLGGIHGQLVKNQENDELTEFLDEMTNQQLKMIQNNVK